MAFVKINKSSMGSPGSENTIRMGWHIQSETHTTRAVYFSMSRDVVERVGWPTAVVPTRNNSDVRVITRVAVHEGTGSDAGFLMLEHDEKGYIIGSNKTGAASTAAFTMNVSSTRFKNYAVNDAVLDKEPEPVEFTIDEKEHSILVQVPEWMRYSGPSDLVVVQDPPPPPPEPVVMNRQQRRMIAKEVASKLTRR